MLIEYKGVRINTFRPLTLNEKKTLEQLEKETPIVIHYRGKRWINTNTGIRESAPTILGDVSVITIKGTRIYMAAPISEYGLKLLSQMEIEHGFKAEYIKINKNDDLIIEYKEAIVDLSNPLGDIEKKLIKQMETDLKKSTVRIRELEAQLGEKDIILKRLYPTKKASTIYINGRSYSYEYDDNNRFIEYRGSRIDMAAPLSSSAKMLLAQMINDKTVRIDNFTRKIIWISPVYYSQHTNQIISDEPNQEYETDHDFQFDF